MATMWPIWSSLNRVLPEDVLFFAYPLEVLRRDALAHGQFPFWNPYWLSGIPAYPNPEAGFAYPPGWLLVWLPPISALNWSITLHVVLAGVAAAWCAGRLGAIREGQFLSGVTWALGSAMVQRLWPGHMNYIQAFAWLPLATGLAATILRGSRTTVYLSATVALLVLAGRPDMFVFAALWLPVWAAAGAWGNGPRVIKALLLTGTALLLGLMLAAVQLLPFAAMLGVSNRFVGLSAHPQTLASLPPWHLLTQLSPRIFGAPVIGDLYWPGEPSDWHERLLYIGIVPLLAALSAIGRWRWICWGLAAAAVTLAFGRFTPVYALVQRAIPLYTNFRVPSRHLGLAVLALALAAGLGLPRLRGRRVAVAVLSSALFVLATAVTAEHWLPLLIAWLGGTGGPALPSASTMAIHAAPGLFLTAALLAVTAGTALLPGPWPVRAQLVLAVADLALVLGPFRANLIDPRPIVQAMEPLRGHERAAVLGSMGGQLANFGPMIKVTQPGGYDNMVGSAYVALLTGSSNPDAINISAKRADDPILSLLGVDAALELTNTSVVSTPAAGPPAWVARCVRPGGATEVRRLEFPRKSCVTLGSATESEPEVQPGTAKVLSQGAGVLRVQAEGPGWLVTTQPWYPGWMARIDDQPTSVAVVDGALVGLQLPTGDHIVDLTYRPAGLTAGALISMTSMVLLAALWWRGRKRREAAPASLPVSPPQRRV
jgi:hypothetical protein